MAENPVTQEVRAACPEPPARHRPERRRSAEACTTSRPTPWPAPDHALHDPRRRCAAHWRDAGRPARGRRRRPGCLHPGRRRVAPRQWSTFSLLLAGFYLAMYMSFTLKANAVLCLTYSAIEGVVLGAISRVLNNAYPGIVVQAVTGTVMVAAGMLFVYRIGAIRVTPKFTFPDPDRRVHRRGRADHRERDLVPVHAPHGLGINERTARCGGSRFLAAVHRDWPR